MTMPYAAGLALVLTDRSQVAEDRNLLDVVAGALEGGAHGVVVRERDLPDPERAALVAAISTLCTAHDALLLVASPGPEPRPGDSPPWGGHLRRDESRLAEDGHGRDWTNRIWARSCHDLAELRRACDEGLDYVTLSPVAATVSKPGYGPALGTSGLSDLISAIRAERETVPTVIALGGVDADNAHSWIESGADGVAVMGAVMRAADPEATMRTIVESVTAAREFVR